MSLTPTPAAAFKLPASLEPDELDVEHYGAKQALGAGLTHHQLLEGQKSILTALSADPQDQRGPSLAAFALDPKRKGPVSLKAAFDDRARAGLEVYNYLEDLRRVLLHQHTDAVLRPSVNPQRAYRENLATCNAAGRNFIRLLAVQERPPGATTTPAVHVRLERYEVQYAPAYAALSYSWGQHEQLVEIRVNGRALEISPDLESALASVAGKYAYFWVDAICINQAHTAEKNDQVRRMKAIYERAEAVLVWLGAVEDDHRDDMGAATATLYGWRPMGLPDEVQERHLLSRRRAAQLLRHGDRAWWSRVWVIQEITSARRPYVCIGSELVAWDEFVKSVTAEPHEYRLVRSQSEIVGRWQAAQAQVKQLHNLRKHLRSSPGGEEILDLMRITCASQASNPRDKVYGLLGLATQRDQAGIHIDYSYSTARAFGDVVLHVIRNKASLDVLVDQWQRGCGIAYDREKGNLPSWIPDFSRPISDGPLPLTHVHAYHASGRRRPEVKLRKPFLEFPLQAVRFDVIEEIMSDCVLDVEPGDELDTFRLITLPSLEAFAYPALRRPLPPDDPRHKITRDDAFWRSLLMDHGADETHAADEDVGAIISILQRTATEELDAVLAALQPFGRRPADVIRQIEHTLRGRALLTTHAGFIGVATCHVRRGDVVVVPVGASVPVVLRPAERKERYTLVVDCFVHGLMYGEMLRLVDSNELRVETFTLI
nr:heterokaryon incompatibility protein 6, or allele [Quercus suber]